jgi:hypothetical protein
MLHYVAAARHCGCSAIATGMALIDRSAVRRASSIGCVLSHQRATFQSIPRSSTCSRRKFPAVICKCPNPSAGLRPAGSSERFLKIREVFAQRVQFGFQGVQFGFESVKAGLLRDRSPG